LIETTENAERGPQGSSRCRPEISDTNGAGAGNNQIVVDRLDRLERQMTEMNDRLRQD